MKVDTQFPNCVNKCDVVAALGLDACELACPPKFKIEALKMKVNIHPFYFQNEKHLMDTLANIVSYGPASQREDGIWEISSSKAWTAEIKNNELHVYCLLPNSENKLKLAVAWIEERYRT